MSIGYARSSKQRALEREAALWDMIADQIVGGHLTILGADPAAVVARLRLKATLARAGRSSLRKSHSWDLTGDPGPEPIHRRNGDRPTAGRVQVLA